MLNNLQKRKEGFTIVEVMIVLAIAGLIILVVLLAVPALQRNSRNTTIKSDASSVAGAVGEFSSANNGIIPNGVTQTAADKDDGKFTLTKTSKTSVSGKVKAGTAVTGATDTTVLTTTDANLGAIKVHFGYKCNDAGNGLNTTANPRSVAVTYLAETSGSTHALNCIDS